MKNTDTLNQTIIDKVNHYRQKQYEKVRSMLCQLTVIDANIRLLIREIECSPDYRYGSVPVADDGPFVSDDVPPYTRPDGCAGCAYHDFAVKK